MNYNLTYTTHAVSTLLILCERNRAHKSTDFPFYILGANVYHLRPQPILYQVPTYIISGLNRYYIRPQPIPYQASTYTISGLNLYYIKPQPIPCRASTFTISVPNLHHINIRPQPIPCQVPSSSFKFHYISLVATLMQARAFLSQACLFV